EEDPAQFAAVQMNLATALNDRARFMDRFDSIFIYEEASAACREALRVRSRTALPRSWAKCQVTLAKSLCGQAATTGGADGAHLAHEAVRAAEQALEVVTRQVAPREWAEARNVVGVAYETLAELEPARAQTFLKSAAEAISDASKELAAAPKARAALRRKSNKIGSRAIALAA
ncbi:MAG: hypothetical protein AAF360_17805, partial [Pseudomonadota bacterium]